MSIPMLAPAKVYKTHWNIDTNCGGFYCVGPTSKNKSKQSTKRTPFALGIAVSFVFQLISFQLALFIKAACQCVGVDMIQCCSRLLIRFSAVIELEMILLVLRKDRVL